MTAKKIFQVERLPKIGDDKSVYGFPNLWDLKSIKEALNHAGKNNIPKFCLSKIEIHPSGKCNLNCGLCYGKPLAPEKRNNLSSETTERIFRDVREKMPQENPLIILSGLYSEPLNNPNIKDILRQLGKYQFRFGLYTNGLLIDDETINIILSSSEKSKATKPSYISFNISSSLVSGNFKKLVEKMKSLIKKRDKLKLMHKLQINAPILAVKDHNSLNNIVKELVSIGVDNIRLSFPWKAYEKNSSKRKISFSGKSYNNAIKIFQTLEKKFPGKIKLRYPQKYTSPKKCFVMAMTLVVSPEGDVYPCPEIASPLFKEKFSYGNLLNERIYNIWHGKNHLKIFQRLNPKKEFCKCCPVDEKFNVICSKMLEKYC